LERKKGDIHELIESSSVLLKVPFLLPETCRRKQEIEEFAVSNSAWFIPDLR
jgi:hypothetical protein